ncbi:MAG: bifunctional folylpolyglutamate synthase/dihydrofolate synthase [Candidatus Saganbacteria bacterium]|nr:bifunctional folylpolyglutamate synthase/dihydrofolate synthase [Candidatus Saganbacteria bacterium]
MDYLKYLSSLEKFGMNLGLDRIRAILSRLGHPEVDFQSIHITGTNGKGSTAAMIASILKQAGYRVGLYTSPHIYDYTERIKVNGQEISKQALSSALQKVRRAARGSKEQPTVFEVLTAAAFLFFSQKKIDIAVLEVGLGGRLDATNVVYPLVSVITNIDLEHTEVLGKSLKKIATEKAAIIKPGVPVVTAEKKAEPLNVIRRSAQKAGATLVQVQGYDSARIPHLLGQHQKLNAACAVAAVRLSGAIVTRAQIKRGLQKTQWPGRYQIISRKPLTIMDGAHNPAGIRALVRTIKDNCPGKYTVIFGCQSVKDFKVMIKELKPVTGELIITRSSHPKAANPAKLVKAARALKQPVHVAHSLAEALERADAATPLLVTGSIFLVADFSKLLQP